MRPYYKIKRIFSFKTAIFFFLFFFMFNAFSQDELVSRMIDSINQRILLKEYDKAFTNSLFVLRNYQGQELTIEAEDACKRAVSAWIAHLDSEKRWEEIVYIEQQLVNAPPAIRALASPAIDKAIVKLKEKSGEPLEWIKKETHLTNIPLTEVSQDANPEANVYARSSREMLNDIDRLRQADEQRKLFTDFLYNMKKLEKEQEKVRYAEREAYEKKHLEIELARIESEKEFKNYFGNIVEENKKDNNRLLFFFLLLFGAFILFLIIAVIIIMLHGQRSARNMFNDALHLLVHEKSEKKEGKNTVLPIQLQPFFNSNSQSIESDTVLGLDSIYIKTLIVQCENYAKEIDMVTGRKNASHTIAELTYKISKHLGYKEGDALIYFAAALIYDIGFLFLDNALFNKGILDDNDIKIIKTHPALGHRMLFFIDENIRAVFEDAVLKHHENLNGSGYPAGLSGKEIPYIARVLRVVESYVALVSNRTYKVISDRNTAIKKLYDEPEIYDMEIVRSLDEIIY